MTKGEFIALLARRLGEPARHVERHVEQLHAAGIIKPMTGCRRYPPDIAEPEAVSILLGIIGAEKIEDAPAAASRLAALTDGTGATFGSLVAEILFGPPRQVDHFIVRRDSVSTVVDGVHAVFGKRADAPARIIPGATLTAIAAELAGMTPAQADAAAAISKIKGCTL